MNRHIPVGYGLSIKQTMKMKVMFDDTADR